MNFLKQFLFLLFLAIILAAPFSLSAQATIDSIPIPINPCTDPNLPCPLDSNLIILVVAAGIIAAKKAYPFKNYVAKV